DGFDGRLDSWTLSKVALLDSILVGIILVLTLVASIWANRREDERDNQLDELAREIESTFADASLALGEREPRQPQQALHMLDSVGKALLDDIREQRQGLAEFTRSQAQASQDLRRSTASLSDATSRVGSMAESLSQSTTAINDFAGQFGQAAEAMAET